MTIEQLDGHKRVLGILYVISSAFTVLGMLLLNTLLSLIFSFAFEEASAKEQEIVEFVMSIAAYIPIFIILFIALPAFIAGIGLLTRQGWAVILSLIVGCLKLFSFPIGTAVGVYAIWIFSEDQKLSRASTSK